MGRETYFRRRNCRINYHVAKFVYIVSLFPFYSRIHATSHNLSNNSGFVSLIKILFFFYTIIYKVNCKQTLTHCFSIDEISQLQLCRRRTICLIRLDYGSGNLPSNSR